MPRNREAELGSRASRSIEDPFGVRSSSLRARAPWLVRRGWVLVLCLVVVVLVAGAVGERKPVTYSATATLSVNTGVTSALPGSPNEAETLASNYSGLIPADTAVVAKVAKAVGMSHDQVRNATAVTVVNGTSLLAVKFTSSTPQGAIAGATALADAVAGSNPADPKNFPAGSVSVAQYPSDVVRHQVKLPIVLGIGVGLGLLLGAVLVLAWERADARVDRPGQLTTILGIPARSLSSLNTMSAAALMARWQGIVGRPAARVALVPGVPGITDQVRELVRRLGLVDRFGSLRVRTNLDPAPSFETAAEGRPWSRAPDQAQPAGAGGPVDRWGLPADHLVARNGSHLPHPRSTDTDDEEEGILLLASGAPGFEGGEAIAQHAHMTVLVVPRGARVRDVQQSAILLDQVGVRPRWGLMMDLRRLRVPSGSRLHDFLSGMEDAPRQPAPALLDPATPAD
ncbi:MAG TPA: hypothetical protein VKV36_02090 [Acidimicrobiales bacterium]|nr:hypothetical protein [Acidimicrobiales bacterium]